MQEDTIYTTDYTAMYDQIGQSAFAEHVATCLVQSFSAEPLSAWIKDSKEQNLPRRVLDLGCGTGAAALVFASAGYEVVGIDRSRAMLLQAQGKAERDKLRVSFVQSDMRALDDIWTEHAVLRPDSFDLVTCLGSSLHELTRADDLGRVCAGVLHLLRPGGRFVFDLIPIQEFTTWDEQNQVLYADPNYVVYQRLSYIAATRQATRRIVWLVREIERWWRGEESHRLRAWRDEEIAAALTCRRGRVLHMQDRVVARGVPTNAAVQRVVYYTRLERV